MKLLVDTQVLLWLRMHPERLSRRVRDRIASGDDELLLSAATPWEMAIKVALGKLRLPCPVEEFVRTRSAALRISALPITQLHAIASAELPMHHRDPFDRVIIAQARLEDAAVLTSDRAFRKYGVDLVWAAGA